MPRFKDEQIGVRITSKQKDILKLIAENRGITLAELLRFMIMNFIDENERKNK